MGAMKSFTAGGWVNVAAITAGNGAIIGNQSVAETGGGAGTAVNNKAGFYLLVSGGKAGARVLAQVNDGGASTTSAIPLGEWVFVAVTYDGTLSENNMKIYTTADASSLTLMGTYSMNAGAVLESKLAVKIGLSLVGLFDNIRLYGSQTDSSGALAEDEIKAWMQSSDVGSGSAPKKPIILG